MCVTQCQGGGCLIELVIQLAIIFLGKQLLQNTLMEILLPRMRKQLKLVRRREGRARHEEAETVGERLHPGGARTARAVP